MNRKQWLKDRQKGLGGSDAAAVLGLSPYKTNTQLWAEKTNGLEPKDIGGKECVQYGIAAEPLIREIFALDNPQYEVQHHEFKIIKHNRYDFLLASLDGELTDKETGEKGVLEIKTTTVHNGEALKKWRNSIPQMYYCQLLHYLNVTGYEFAILKVRIRLGWSDEEISEKQYRLEAAEVEQDLTLLQAKEIEFWQAVENDKQPAELLPTI